MNQSFKALLAKTRANRPIGPPAAYLPLPPLKESLPNDVQKAIIGNVSPNSFGSEQAAVFQSVTASTVDNDTFITGGAGVGKSYLTAALYQFAPAGSVLCATTGQAAQVIGGRTLHSFIGLVPRRGLSDPRLVEARICACKRLYVDEISMLSDINFGHMMTRFEDLNHFPQLILIGDFLQLPPVNRDDEQGHEHRFAFRSPYWKNIKGMLLTQQHRQSDPEFISALNDIRIAKLSKGVVDLIASRTVKELPDDSTQLFATRAAVAEVNSRHVLMLDGTLEYFPGELWVRDNLERSVDKGRFRFPETLHLRPRSRIIMLNNDKQNRWANGSTGIMHSSTKTEIKVVLDNGYQGSVERIKEEQIDGNGRVIATMNQFPMMLGKALTIHKAQGMSLERVSVGLEELFECAHLYVPLSRCKTRNGLFLRGQIKGIKVHPEAMAFYGY